MSEKTLKNISERCIFTYAEGVLAYLTEKRSLVFFKDSAYFSKNF